MTTVQYDAVTIENIPDSATHVAGYVAGSYVTVPGLRERFPHAHVMTIAIAHDQAADCLDIEPGDSSPALAPAFWKLRRQAGQHVIWLYASRDTVPAVIAAMTAAGIPRSDYRIWSAHYGIGPHICASTSCGAGFRADMTQWTDRADGRSLDESLAAAGALPPVKTRSQVKASKKAARKKKAKKAAPRPKVVGAGLGAAISTGVFAILTHHGVHLTGVEHQAIAGAAAVIAGYLTPDRVKRTGGKR